MSYRVGVVTTHPIQYQVPWFRLLAGRPDIDLTVFYSQIPSARQQGDGFGIAFEWDVSLLDGYPYKVLPNVAKTPSVTTFRGCDTPALYHEILRDRFDAVIVQSDSRIANTFWNVFFRSIEYGTTANCRPNLP
jgi:hypothetical protein